ncbi:MAG: prepilin-type N-terminal cleavage/methylation domain-containing protein [Planctomycetota bacterium]
MGPSNFSASKHSRRGTTLLELVIVMAILIVAVSMFSQIVASTAQLRATSHERALAAEAARAMIERMRNEELNDVFDLFNASKADDPAGAGSAPGHRFRVRGLSPRDDDGDGFVGEIYLPAMFMPEGSNEGLTQQGLEAAAGGSSDDGTSNRTRGMLTGRWSVREDAEIPELGMPRDLNGDGHVDGVDHRYDLHVLPVCVKVSWKGSHGDRSLQIYTLLTNFDPGEF